MTTDTCTIWVCQCCMLTAANGECCADEHDQEPLSSIGEYDNVACTIGWDDHDSRCLRKIFGPDGSTLDPCDCGSEGTLWMDHFAGCPVHTAEGLTKVPSDYECDCETNPFSWSSCEGCGNYRGAERYALTVFINERMPSSVN